MRNRAVTALAALTAILVLAACGSNEDDLLLPMDVVGTEMAFSAPEQVASGTYAVTFRNDGAMYHELAFTDPGGNVVARRSIAGGQQVTLEVELEPGTWELGCYEPGHYEAGMFQDLVVTPA